MTGKVMDLSLEKFNSIKSVLIHTKLLMGINASQVNRLTVQTIYNTNNSIVFVTMHTSDMMLTMKRISLYI